MAPQEDKNLQHPEHRQTEDSSDCRIVECPDASKLSNVCFTNATFVNDDFSTKRQLPVTNVEISDLSGDSNTKRPCEPIDFDDILPYIGEFGLYQKILFLLMIPFAFSVAFVYFTQIFITVTPEQYWCRIPELQNYSIEQRKALAIPLIEIDGVFQYDQCRMYDVNFGQLFKQGQLEPNSSWPTTTCRHGYEFDFSDIPYTTIATELEWVCDKAALPSIAQAIFFGGAILGGLIFGWIADRYGRIPALVGSNIIGLAGGILTAFSSSFWEFCVWRFFVGMAFDNCFTMMYIIVLEYVGPQWRTFVANMSIAIFFTLASSMLPWLAYFIADWKMLCIVTSIPLLAAFATPWLVPESARWLVSQGKIDTALGIMKKFERINGKHVKPQMYQDFKDSCTKVLKENESNSGYSVLDLFKSPRLRNITILLIVIWMVISLCFDGHVRNVGSLGLDLFLTFTIASATELPADTFLTMVLDRWGRRWLACGSMIVSGVFSLLACLAPIGTISASLAIMGRFSVNISYNIGLQYAAEVLPTVVRAQGVALIHIMGYVASILAPFVVYLANISPVLPLMILGVLGIFGGVLCLFLPETLDQVLPQTLQDGEEFGKGQKLWDFPCCGKSDDDENVGNYRSKENASIYGSKRSLNVNRISFRGGELRSSMINGSIRSRKNNCAEVIEP